MNLNFGCIILTGFAVWHMYKPDVLLSQHVSGAGVENVAEQAQKPDEWSGSGTWKTTVEREQSGEGEQAESAAHT